MNRRHRGNTLEDVRRRAAALPRLHLFTALSSLGRLWRGGIGGIMTVCVIAIALALPSVFLLALENLENATQRGRSLGELTVFFQADADADAIAEAGRLLAEGPEVAAVQLMSAEETLQEFKELSGFAEALDVGAAI